MKKMWAIAFQFSGGGIKFVTGYDFIIVGSGAGGGPLAANLALNGHRVLLLEAGGDEINDAYLVPAFHPISTEDPARSWEFFVSHYSDDRNPERDVKHHPNKKFDGKTGIFYPRASGLGGCTTHHAMITVYPHESDWDNIAEITGDPSWKAVNMRRYFDRMERPEPGNEISLLDVLDGTSIFETIGSWFRSSRSSLGKRGKGWLTITQADPLLLSRDLGGVLKVVNPYSPDGAAH